MDLIQKITDVINGKRHQDYEHVKALAHLYRQIVLKVQQDQLVLEYKPSETRDQKASRLEINKSKTPASTARVLSQYKYVNGTSRSHDNIEYAGKSDPKQAAESMDLLNKIISRFYGKQSLQQYLEQKQLPQSAIDPNAWLVIDSKSSPIIIPCDNALDFIVKGGLCEYLVVGYLMPKKEWTDEIYYGYTAGMTISVIAENQGKTDYPEGKYTQLFVNDKNYRFYEYPNTTIETPAIRFGYDADDRTDGRTFVGIFDKVTEDYKDVINQNSELMLALNKHLFLQKLQIVEACDYREGHIKCVGGQLSPTGGKCGACNGSGVKSHTSTQDALSYAMPKTAEGEIPIKLSEMVHYVQMPIEIVKIQMERVKDSLKEIPKAIFGVDIDSRPSGMATATEINNYYESMYITLSTYADKISENYIFAVTAIAQMNGLADGLVISHRYPRTFKMETLAELMVLLKDARNSGASSAVTWGIEQRIIEMQNRDNPAAVSLAKIKHRLKPFKELSENERIIEISNLPPDNRYRVLHGYGDFIFQTVMQKNPNFLSLEDEKQDEIVYAVADELAKTFTPPAPSLEMPTEMPTE